MDTNKKNRERISALSDDALPKEDHELACAALHTAEGMAAWEVYHLIKDALRARAAPELPVGFTTRLAARLASEPLHPRRSPVASPQSGALAQLDPSPSS